MSPTALGATERQRAITLVGPRSPVLSGSLRRALTFGACKRPSDAHVLEVAAKFGLGGVIRRLGGLGGHVAEGGRNLSAGEVRRLTLARAALSRSGLLLLDEPDETLDAGGEALLALLIRETDATVLMVTHSPTLAERMDRIWRIEGGRLVEDRPAADGQADEPIEPARSHSGAGTT
jgi:ABC-type transport system involved in cytochrome bd biosynthesis fused ATPase/permease subunit